MKVPRLLRVALGKSWFWLALVCSAALIRLGPWWLALLVMSTLIYFVFFSNRYRSGILADDERHHEKLVNRAAHAIKDHPYLTELLQKTRDFLKATTHNISLDLSEAVGVVLRSFVNYVERTRRIDEIKKSCDELCSLLGVYHESKAGELRRKCRETKRLYYGLALEELPLGIRIKRTLVYLALGACIVWYFGLSESILEWGWAKDRFQGWELGALVYNAVSAFLFVCYYSNDGKSVDKAAISAQPFVVLLCSYVAWDALKKGRVEEHLLGILGVAIIAWIFDLLLMRQPREDSDEFRRLFWYVDSPTLVGFITITIFWNYCPERTGLLNAFVSGSIAFQLIASNIVFALIQGGFGNVQHEAKRQIGVAAGV
jgi:hypothetical protein